jgi:hypothetical protein
MLDIDDSKTVENYIDGVIENYCDRHAPKYDRIIKDAFFCKGAERKVKYKKDNVSVNAAGVPHGYVSVKAHLKDLDKLQHEKDRLQKDLTKYYNEQNRVLSREIEVLEEIGSNWGSMAILFGIGCIIEAVAIVLLFIVW